MKLKHIIILLSSLPNAYQEQEIIIELDDIIIDNITIRVNEE